MIYLISEMEEMRAKGRKASCWFYLITNGPIDGKWERTDIASSQVILLPLVAEELKLSLLLLIQHVTITHLNNTVSHQNRAHKNLNTSWLLEVITTKINCLCIYEKFEVLLYLIVMRWQLVKQLFEAIFLSRAVYIGDLLFWQGVIILMHLKQTISEMRLWYCRTVFKY